eukprot:585765-Rhodomonas_salina.2
MFTARCVYEELERFVHGEQVLWIDSRPKSNTRNRVAGCRLLFWKPCSSLMGAMHMGGGSAPSGQSCHVTQCPSQ